MTKNVNWLKIKRIFNFFNKKYIFNTVKKEKLKESYKYILRFFLNKKNLGRDIIVVVIAIGLVGLFFVNNPCLFREKKESVDANNVLPPFL